MGSRWISFFNAQIWLKAGFCKFDLLKNIHFFVYKGITLINFLNLFKISLILRGDVVYTITFFYTIKLRPTEAIVAHRHTYLQMPCLRFINSGGETKKDNISLTYACHTLVNPLSFSHVFHVRKYGNGSELKLGLQ